MIENDLKIILMESIVCLVGGFYFLGWQNMFSELLLAGILLTLSITKGKQFYEARYTR